MELSKVRGAFLRRIPMTALAVALGCATLMPAGAEDHIVSTQALRQTMEAQSQTRQKDIAAVQSLFRTPAAQRAMKMAHVEPTQVQRAIPTLSNAELASLSARARTAQQDFAAGAISEETLLLVIIGMLFIIILVAIH